MGVYEDIIKLRNSNKAKTPDESTSSIYNNILAIRDEINPNRNKIKAEEPKKKTSILGQIGKEAVSLSNRIGEGALDLGNWATDALLQYGSSKYNPYYIFNPDQLKGNQQVSRDLIKATNTEATKKALGYTPEMQAQLDKGSFFGSDKFAGQIARSASTEATKMVVTGGLSGGSIANAIKIAPFVSGIQGYGSGIESAYNAGVTDRTTANLAGSANAAIEFITDKIIPGSPGFRNLPEGVNTIKAVLKNYGLNVVGEGFEEGLSAMLSPIVNEYIYTGNKEDNVIQKGVSGFNKIDWKEVIQEAISGAIVGGILDAGNISGNVKNINQEKQRQVAQKQFDTAQAQLGIERYNQDNPVLSNLRPVQGQSPSTQLNVLPATQKPLQSPINAVSEGPKNTLANYAKQQGWVDSETAPVKKIARPEYNNTETFTNKETTPLKTDKFTFISAENPNAKQATPEFNKQATEKLKQRLDELGVEYQEVKGHYGGNVENSFYITNLDAKTAQELSKEFGQESVLTSEGMIYQDGSKNPIDLQNIGFDQNAEDYYTEMQIGDKVVKVQIPVDFDTKIPASQPTTETKPTQPTKILDLVKENRGIRFKIDLNNASIKELEAANKIETSKEIKAQNAKKIADLKSQNAIYENQINTSANEYNQTKQQPTTAVDMAKMEGNVEQQPTTIAETTDGEVKQRSLIKKNIEGLSPEMVDLIDNSTYVVMQNEKAVSKANEKLATMTDPFKTYQDKFKANEKFKAEDIAAVEILYNKAKENGDYKTAADLLENLGVLGTEYGQTIQALSMLNKLTPEGKYNMIAKQLNRTQKKFSSKEKEVIKKRNKKLVEQDTVTNSTAKKAAKDAIMSEFQKSKIQKYYITDEVKQYAKDTYGFTDIEADNLNWKTIKFIKEELVRNAKNTLKKQQQKDGAITQIEEQLKQEERLVKEIEKELGVKSNLFMGGQERPVAIDLSKMTSSDQQKVIDAISAKIVEETGVSGSEADALSKKIVNRYMEQLKSKKMQQVKQLETGEIKLSEEAQANILGSKNPLALEIAVDDALQELSMQMPVKLSQTLDSMRHLSNLFNPKTHIKNVLSNTAMSGLAAYKNKVAGLIEDAIATRNPEMERTKTARKASPEMLEFAKADANKPGMRKRISGESKFDRQSKLSIPRRSGLWGPLNWLSEKNLDLLDAEDAKASGPAYAKAFANYATANNYSIEFLNSNSKEGMTALEKTRQHAIIEAQEQTFRQPNQIADAINKFERSHPIAGIFTKANFAYKKTPLNIAKTGVEYSPVSIVQAYKTFYDAKQALNDGNQELYNTKLNQGINTLSKGLSGSSLILLGMLLGQAGWLSGGDEDEERGINELTGKTPYSINIPFTSTSISIDFLAPSLIPLFFGANISQQINRGELSLDEVSSYLSIAKAGSDTLIDTTIIGNVDNLFSSWGGIENLALTSTLNLGGQFVPSIGGSISKTLDPVRRSAAGSGTGNAKKIDAWVNQQKMKIPGLSSTLPAYVDVAGNKQIENDPFARFIINFVSPSKVKTLKETETTKELERLYKKTGDTTVLPSMPNKTFQLNKETIKLSPEDYSKFSQNDGKYVFAELDKLVKKSSYKNASDERKIEMIKKYYEIGQKVAKQKYLQER